MSYKILIADDESHILNVVALKLRNAGYEVVTAVDGGDAFAKAVEHQPAMLITDFHMPVLNGLDLCVKLRRETDWAGPAVLLTARGSEIECAMLTAGGISAVVSKPFSPREVLKTVEASLQAA